MSRKHNPENLTQHHKKCKSNGGKTTIDNCIWLPQHIHQSWHNLFGNLLPHEIAEIINVKLLDPDFKFVCVRR